VPPRLDPAAFAAADPAAAVTQLGGATMGTGWSVRAVLPPRLDAPAVQATVEARLAGLVAEMSHWEPDSLLSCFNCAAAGSWHALPPDFAAVVAAGLDVAARSDGAFDPALGALVDAWGYGPAPRERVDLAEVASASAVSGWPRLVWDGAGRRLRQPGGCRLDLSGIAKGYAVDAVAGMLADMGVRHALVEIGGELAGWGVRPDLEPWWVELETPAEMPPLRVALHGLSVATSGDYVRGLHTIDGRSGRPVGHALGVSVLHDSAMLADAWASALTVAGPGDGERLAIAERLAVRALWREEGRVREWLSPAMLAMLAD
jgi:FAD:protein FMN transferase